MNILYKWLNHEKSRFYFIWIKKNISNEIILSHKWGAINNNRGGKKNVLMQTEEEAQTFINQMMKRRKSRGYVLIAPFSY